MAAQWTMHFDGGTIGNPGPAAGAAVLAGPNGESVRVSRFLERATNNQAEYAGLQCGLEAAHAAGATELVVRGDSKLVVCQFTGEWRVKEVTLQTCLAEAKTLAKPFTSIDIGWIPREENGEADLEVRRCLDANVPKSMSVAASFQELAALKVGGQDKFSRMKRPGLLELLGDGAEAAVTVIATALADVEGDREKLELVALRWVARGQDPVRAAQKVLVDLEISRKAAKARSRHL